MEDGIEQRWVAYGHMPVCDPQLACDDCGVAVVAEFEDLQEVTSLGGGQDGEALASISGNDWDNAGSLESLTSDFRSQIKSVDGPRCIAVPSLWAAVIR